VVAGPAVVAVLLVVARQHAGAAVRAMERTSVGRCRWQGINIFLLRMRLEEGGGWPVRKIGGQCCR